MLSILGTWENDRSNGSTAMPARTPRKASSTCISRRRIRYHRIGASGAIILGNRATVHSAQCPSKESQRQCPDENQRCRRLQPLTWRNCGAWLGSAPLEKMGSRYAHFRCTTAIAASPSCSAPTLSQRTESYSPNKEHAPQPRCMLVPRQ